MLRLRAYDASVFYLSPEYAYHMRHESLDQEECFHNRFVSYNLCNTLPTACCMVVLVQMYQLLMSSQTPALCMTLDRRHKEMLLIVYANEILARLKATSRSLRQCLGRFDLALTSMRLICSSSFIHSSPRLALSSSVHFRCLQFDPGILPGALQAGLP